MAGPKYVKDFEFPSSAGFHGSAGVQHVRGYARGGKPKETGAQRAKVGKVMGEFKAGDLRSGSKKGPVVTNPKQAQAIALSEAGVAAKPNLQARMKKPGGYAKGGKAKGKGHPAYDGTPKIGCDK